MDPFSLHPREVWGSSAAILPDCGAHYLSTPTTGCPTRIPHSRLLGSEHTASARNLRNRANTTGRVCAKPGHHTPVVIEQPTQNAEVAQRIISLSFGEALNHLRVGISRGWLHGIPVYPTLPTTWGPGRQPGKK